MATDHGEVEALRSATENAMAAYAELAEVKAGNSLLREALRLACEDGWDDGQWAMRRYIELAQAALSGRRDSEGFPCPSCGHLLSAYDWCPSCLAHQPPLSGRSKSDGSGVGE